MSYSELSRIAATPLDQSVDRAIADENENPRGLPTNILAGMEAHMRKNAPHFFNPFYFDLRACAETNS